MEVPGLTAVGVSLEPVELILRPLVLTKCVRSGYRCSFCVSGAGGFLKIHKCMLVGGEQERRDVRSGDPRTRTSTLSRSRNDQ